MAVFRKVFAGIFTVLFLWLSLMLAGEFNGLPYHDTSLFWIGGSSVGMQSLGKPLVDLSPTLVRILWIASAAAMLVGFRKGFADIAGAVCCGVMALLIASVHCTTLLFKPFMFSDNVTTYVHIQKWVWYFWFTFASESVYFIGMPIVKRIARTGSDTNE